MTKFISLDIETRMATFQIGEALYTRQIADNVDDSNVKEHLEALARGLEMEVAAEEVTVPTVTAAPFEEGEEI